MDQDILAQLSPEEINALWEGPAMEPPADALIDFANPGGQHTLAYFVLIFGAVLATLSVILRLIARFYLKKIAIEDGLFICALGLFAGFLYVTYEIAIWPGFRVHQWNIQLKNMPQFLFYTYVGSICYGLTVMLLKASILFNWIHIFVPTGMRNSMFWISHILIWTNILFYGVGTVVEIFQCSPREKIWNPLFIGGHCPIDMPKHMMASGAINLVSDIVILILPQRVIWGLNIAKRRKVEISILFAIGIFACVSAVIRLVYLLKMLSSEDAVYTVSEVALWTVAEITAGFLIMGLPSLPKVVRCIPGSASMISFFRSITGQSQPDGSAQSNSRRGLPSWYKPRSQPRRPRDPFHITGDESQTDMVLSLGSFKSADNESQDMARVSTGPDTNVKTESEARLAR